MIWIGVAYSFVVCWMVLYMHYCNHTWETAFPAFFAFLPMVFGFVAWSHIQSLKQVEKLQVRIAQLEARNTAA